MALDFDHKSGIGLVLMLIGTLAFIPALFPEADGFISLVTVPAVVLLTIGTYFVGTDIRGQPV